MGVTIFTMMPPSTKPPACRTPAAPLPGATPTSQRRESTARGSRHAGDQRQLPGSETSAARQEFLYALYDALPYEARVQLRTCTQDEVPAWAERWGIHAPCVLEAARANVAFASQESDPPNIEARKKCTCSGDRCRHHYGYRFGLRGNDYFGKTRRSNYASAMAVAHADYQRIERALGDPPPEWRSLSEQFTDSYRGPKVPSAWRKKLRELNALPIDTAWLDDVLESPIEPIAGGPDEQFRDRAKRLAASGPMGQKMAARLTGTLQRHGGSVQGAAPRLQRHLERLRRPLANLRRQGRLDDDTFGWVRVLAAIVHDVDATQQAAEEARAAALRQPRVLAPVGADPVRESLTQFLRRARNHWHARTVDVDTIAHQLGLTFKAAYARAAQSQHIRWLVRYQVHRESYEAIGKQPCHKDDVHASPHTVRLEVRRLAAQLELTLRSGRPRGRPRKKRREP